MHEIRISFVFLSLFLSPHHSWLTSLLAWLQWNCWRSERKKMENGKLCSRCEQCFDDEIYDRHEFSVFFILFYIFFGEPVSKTWRFIDISVWASKRERESEKGELMKYFILHLVDLLNINQNNIIKSANQLIIYRKTKTSRHAKKSHHQHDFVYETFFSQFLRELHIHIYLVCNWDDIVI